eukprot:952805-Pelagomonas_calceolata.AAC.1
MSGRANARVGRCAAGSDLPFLGEADPACFTLGAVHLGSCVPQKEPEALAQQQPAASQMPSRLIEPAKRGLRSKRVTARLADAQQHAPVCCPDRTAS